MNCTQNLSRLLLASLLITPLAACAPQIANRGNMISDDQLTALQANSTADKAAIQQLLGPPTAVATFDPNIWYYSGQRTEKTAFFDPDVVAARTLVLQFDAAGTLQQWREVQAGEQTALTPEARETPTVGKSMSAFEQLIDNLSRPGLPGSITNQNRRSPGTITRGGGVGR